MDAQLLSAGVIVLAAVVLIGLERWKPYSPGQRLFREGFFTDLFWYSLVQSYVLGLVIAAFITWIDGHSGLSRLRLLSDWPLAAQVVFFVVTHDLYIYWAHRAQHTFLPLWRIHEAHHSVKDVDWLGGARSHAVEILINQTVEFAPIVLLGAPPEVAIIKGTISAIWGMFIHANIDVRMGALQKVINGPEMHRWHHAVEITEGGLNYGTKLAIWDWIFRTAYLPKHKPRGFGLSDVAFPKSYFAQQLFAFRRTSRVRSSPSAVP